jgi:hypothetical protein
LGNPKHGKEQKRIRAFLMNPAINLDAVAQWQ